MKKLKLVLFLTGIFISQNVYSQIKTVKGGNLSPAEIDAFLQKQMDSLQIPALSIAIINNNKVVYQKAFGTKNSQQEKINDHTFFEAASMTKPMFAYTVHQLVKEKVLELDTPLYKYLPYKDIADDERYKLITAKMILDHTSGFPNRRENNKLTINFTPGTKFDYSGEGYEYLSKVIEHLTGKKIDEVMQQYIFKPLKMKNSYMSFNEEVNKNLLDGIRDNGERGRNEPYLQPDVASSLYTEPQEYAKFVIELMKESQIKNSIFQTMAKPQIEIHEADMDPNLKIAMGLGVFVENTPYGAKYSHGGSNGNCYNSLFQIYKEPKVGFVYFMAGCKLGEFAVRMDKFINTGK
ncbi:CubicO group peptidase (beta-lactamase class C family) [Chryseobacterium ginsenosidimutans]|uniref:serine hydrolase domain-containing protein n=1 Tax=Chryseobacterium ginsenosidimutans TaxID=687846 RepID=UPI00216A9817|nr:serine hydrolase domain-containing protein [Chryseobacterium ginsenosidimutans]MCS3869574.1 CubicO group peptidase (beta-lactamase class C family) [Chryseobacterium ginsenosidimutans]